MRIFDLYGIRAGGLEDAKKRVEEALGTSLAERDSDYMGGTYFRCDASAYGALILRSNYNPVDGDWAAEEFQELPFLLHVNDAKKTDEAQARLGDLADAVLLSRRTV